LKLRRERGAFKDAEELLDVRGIGPATLERFRDKLVIQQDSLPSGARP
jgi:DNA uptake protein ComE-like DNA-binding protein